MTLLWVDPPSGWRYGFPKLFDKDAGIMMNDWLIKEGYPAAEATNLPWVRMWEPTEEECAEYLSKTL